MLVLGVLLFLFRMTGMTVHIGVTAHTTTVNGTKTSVLAKGHINMPTETCIQDNGRTI